MAQQTPTPEATPFATDSTDEVPVGTQLGWRLTALILTGRVGPGEALPSVRSLAEWAEVNVNTVRSVYAELEERGLVVTRHGLGTFVRDDVVPRPELEEIATEAILRVREAGGDPRELAVVAMVCSAFPEALPAELPAPAEDPATVETERAAARELRRQITRLEAELAPYVRDLALGQGRRYLHRPEARVMGVEELERVRDELLGRLAEARKSSAKRSDREAEARIRRDSMVRDPKAHKWEVVSAAEVGEPGCVDYRVQPRFGPLGALMNWWRVKVSGGCP
jgi:DNA-binding transcriptional regulator YhcF (GntR family)